MASCFVVQGFGKKTDFTDGRVLDLDASYAIIKDAVTAAGLACIRADEIAHSGSIDVPMYQQLLHADLVIADLSTYNVNAAFELGVRYALRPRATIIVAEDGFKNPFDVGHLVIRRYKHLGEDIGVKEAKRFREELKQAIAAILARGETDSPVYTFLPGLIPPCAERGPGAPPVPFPAPLPVPFPAPLPVPFPAPLPEPLPLALPASLGATPADRPTAAAVPFTVDQAMAGTAGIDLPIVQRDGVVAPATLAAAATEGGAPGEPAAGPTAKARVEEAQAKMRCGDFVAARALWRELRAQRPNDSFVIQQLALATYKARQPTAEAALAEAKAILRVLQPESTNDPETLGLWGAIYKRQWDITRRIADLNESIAAYGRGFYLKQDYYNGINLAFLLELRALTAWRVGERDEGVTDSVLARRIRREVISYAEPLLARDYADEKRYWILATLCEAAAGLGDEAAAGRWAAAARALAMPDWMTQSTRLQIEKLLDMQAEVARLSAASAPRSEIAGSA